MKEGHRMNSNEKVAKKEKNEFVDEQLVF